MKQYKNINYDKGFVIQIDKSKGRLIVKAYLDGRLKTIGRLKKAIMIDCRFEVDTMLREKILKENKYKQHSKIICKGIQGFKTLDGFDKELFYEIDYDYQYSNFFYIVETKEPCYPQAIMMYDKGKLYGTNKNTRQFI